MTAPQPAPGTEHDPAPAGRGVEAPDSPEDAADQAARLTRQMEAEATSTRPAGRPRGGGDATEDVLLRPLEDIEEVLGYEDASDASDDPMHAGGLRPDRWLSAEQAAMHVIDEPGGQARSWLSDRTDAERADPLMDPFEAPGSGLTAQDQTLLGINPDEPEPRDAEEPP